MEENTVTPNVTLDLTGLTCPHPLLGARKVLEGMQPGNVLLLRSDCPGTYDDLFTWVRRTDNEIVRTDQDQAGVREYYIRKGKRPALHANLVLDMQGVTCPGPVVEARKILAGIRPGEIMKLVTSCAASKDEVATWSGAMGHELLETVEVDPGVWAFYIRKRGG